jgi:RNA polymerase sigma-70 factor (ECF subfamily)
MDGESSPEALCRRLKASDENAFSAIFGQWRPILLRYAGSIVDDGATAHDVVQDVFVDLWEMRTRLDPSQSLRALLYRMTRYRAFTQKRNYRTRSRKHDEIRQQADPPLTGPAEALEASDLQNRLHTWIDKLPERQREALVLSRMHDLSHREIADIMGVSPRTVNNHIIRALGTLMSRIEALEPTLLDAS